MLTFVRTNAQYLSSTATITPPTSGTVSFWVTMTTLANTEYLMNFETTNFFVSSFSNGSVSARFRANSTITSTNGSFVAGGRYFVTGTWLPVSTNTLQTLYINAASAASNTSTTTATGARTLYVGASAVTTNTLNGSVEDFRFYNRVLSLSEIQTLYACKGVDNIVYGLTNRWFMNDRAPGAAGTIAGSIKDEASTPNNLTAGGTTGTPSFNGSLLKHRRTFKY